MRQITFGIGILVLLASVGGMLSWSQHRTIAQTQVAAASNGITLTEDPTPPPGFASSSDMVANDTQVVGPIATPRTPPEGSKEYRSEHYRFSVFYPDSLQAQAYDEDKGEQTITFQNPDAGQGFQIFIVPYGARQVSADRFKQDEPSGVMKEPLDIQIDGVTGTTFKSKDTFLGETREVWFIHDGYLFEITTPISLDAWLASIMTTWKFI